jgi:hypothetical protein
MWDEHVDILIIVSHVYANVKIFNYILFFLKKVNSSSYILCDHPFCNIVRLLLGVLLTLIEVDRIESGGKMLAKANAIPLR